MSLAHDTLQASKPDHSSQSGNSVAEIRQGAGNASGSNTGVPKVERAQAASPKPFRQSAPRWAVMSSAIWVAVAMGYILAYGGITPSPWVIGGIIAGVSAPLLVIWLVALMEMRALEVDHLTGPVRRQLAALLAPGMAAENRVRRVTQLLSEQAEQLRQAAGIALEDSSAAMGAITRQSSELRRISAEAMLELGRVGKSAEQTLKHLEAALAQLNTQTGGEREKALALVTELERHTRSVMAEVESLSNGYEQKLSKLNETSVQLEKRAHGLVGLTDEIDAKVESAANESIRDITRLEALMAEVAQRSAAIAHQLDRPITSLESAAGSLDRNMRQSQEMLSSATSNLSAIGDTVLGRATSLVENLSDRLGSLELVGAKLVSVGAATQAETGRYVAQIEAAAERMQNQTADGHALLRDMLSEYERLSLQGLQHNESTVERLRLETEHLTHAFDQTGDQLETLMTAVDARADKLASAGQIANRSLEETTQILDAAQNRFATQLERLSLLGTRLGDEIAKAETGTARMVAANQTAQDRATEILSAGDDTRALLETITSVLTEQQSSVRELSQSIAQQVSALTDALVLQRREMAMAATTVDETGASSRTVLTEHLKALGQASVDAGQMLDGLNTRLEAQTAGVAAVADRVDARLRTLVANVQAELEGFSSSNERIEQEQKTLADLIERADRHIASFNGGLVEAQKQTVSVMDGVADKLSALRAEVELTGQMLDLQGETVEARQATLKTGADESASKVEALLGKLVMLTDGLGSAGRAVEAQGQAATALMGQAEQALSQSTKTLVDEQQIARMALADIASELAHQQQKLEQLQAASAAAAAHLQQQGQDVSSSLGDVIVRMETSAEALKLRSEQGRQSVDLATDQFEYSSTVLEAGVRSGLSVLTAAETSLAQAGKASEERVAALSLQMQALQSELAGVQSALTALGSRGEAISAQLQEQTEQAVDATATVEKAAEAAVGAGQRLQAQMTEIRNAAEDTQDRTAASVAGLQAALDEIRAANMAGESLLAEASLQMSLAGGALNDNARLAEGKLTGATQVLRLATTELQDKLATAQAALASASTGLGDEAAQANAHIQTLQADVAGLQAALETLGYRSEQLSGALTQSTVRAEQSAVQIETAAAKADSASQKLQERMEELSGVASQQQRALGQLGEAIVDTQMALDYSGAKSESQLRTMLAELAGAGERADAAVAQIIERLAGAGSRIGTETAEAEQQLALATEALRRTSLEFVERIATAESSLNDARSTLTEAGNQAAAQMTSADHGLQSLAIMTERNTAALTGSSQQVAHLAADVGAALERLLSDMEQLDQRSHHHATQMEELGGRLGVQLERVGEAGSMALARQEQLLGVLARTQDSFGEIGIQVNSVRDIVSDVTDRAAQRLGAVNALLQTQSEQARSAVETVADKIQQSGDVAREQFGLLGTVADQVEQRLTNAVTAVESRRASLMQAADTTLTRLGVVNEGFAETVARADTVQAQLLAQVQHSEHVLSGLTTLSETTTETLEHTGQRMAMLAQQAAQDSTRLSSVAEKISQQQEALRHSTDAALAVLQSVQAQLMTSGQESVNLIEANEARMSDVLVAMTERMTNLSRQNEAMVSQFGDMLTRFSQSASELQTSGHSIGAELLNVTGQMHTRALDLTASGQQFDRELKARLGSLDATKDHLQGYFDRFGRELAEIDSRTNNALIDLDRRTGDTFGKLQTGVERLAALPDAMEVAQGLLSTQVETARAEIARLRSDLIDIGQQVEQSVGTATGSSTQLLGHLREVSSQSRLSAEQLDQASQQLVSASQQAWDMIGQAAGANGENLSALLNTLGGARDQLGTITDAARTSIETLLERVGSLHQLVEGSIGSLATRYQDITRDGFNGFEKLNGLLDSSANRLTVVSQQAKDNLSSSSELIVHQQESLLNAAQAMGGRLSQVTVQLESLRDGLAGLDARLEYVEPALGAQQSRLDSFLSALDRTLQQVTSLQNNAKDLSREHLELASQIQEQESRMLATATQLEGSLGHVDSTLSGSVLSRLQQALEQVQQADTSLGRLSTQAGRMDGMLGQVRASLQEDVRALETAELGLNAVAERSTGKMLEVGTALNTTLGQLQKGSQLSQAGLAQANEETQRMVVRLEQVRTLIKSMMGAIGTDLTEWQADLKRKMAALAHDVSEQAARSSAVAGLPPLPPSLGQSLRITPPTSTDTVSVPNATQLAQQALHAMAVDLYRVLHAEVPELARSMMPLVARRQPMTPEDARTYTRTLLEQRTEAMRGFIRQLYQGNDEFRQYVNRYLARFEAQYDLVVRGADGVALATRWRQSEVGQLYLILAKAIERKSAAAGVSV